MQSLNIKHNSNGVEILVRGTVQGVGFRPFIYNLASRLTISGTVTNTSEGVVIFAAATENNLKLFLQAIKEQAPPLAKITSIESKSSNTSIPEQTFSILPSVTTGFSEAAIPPDISVCQDCMHELENPADRRYQYPFTNCTNCGPRFSIVKTIPYDRPKTSMQVFPMCVQCSKEYHDPANRRFHAQPNACPDCGPTVSFHNRAGDRLESQDPIAETALLLASGKIVAIKGLGGYHLAVDAYSEDAVSQLRERKQRPEKPLAIMAADICQIQEYCHLSTDDVKLLTSPEHPIVLLKKKAKTKLAHNLAPNIDELGVMLPYTPLHHVLFQHPDCPEALVMTSGNMSGTPICTTNEEALSRLSTICDNFLMHNRGIVTRVDDSVVKANSTNSLIFRRARGYVPAPIEIPLSIPQSLGCGGGLKSTFSLGRRHTVCTSQHIGDLDNLESFEFYQESIEHLQRVLRLEPELVVCDLHPDYMSSHYADKLALPLYRVQHHHAHAVAVMAEHALEDPVLSIILDGTGLGEDGTIWGGEILRTDLTSFERLSHLSHLQLPGGDLAATQPWRMGLSALFSTFGEEGLHTSNLTRELGDISKENLTVISAMLNNGFNSPLSSSCGRLFDAIASLLGLRQVISYEGQAAMELETLARRKLNSSWLEDTVLNIKTNDAQFCSKVGGKWEIDSTQFIKMVVDGAKRGNPPAKIAADFHIMLIESIARVTEKLTEQTGIKQVVLAGGCLQNSILLEGLTHVLNHLNLKVFTGKSLPINDGAISFGQVVIGGLRHVSGNSHESNSS